MSNTSNKNPSDMRTVMNRRKLLRGVSALAAALTSPSWMNSTAFGADASGKGTKRFIGLFSSVGTVGQGGFFPLTKAASSPLEITPIIKPMAKYVDKMLMLHGVHMSSIGYDTIGGPRISSGAPHAEGPNALFTGGALSGGPYADRISVDQYLAQKLGQSSAFPSLEFGVQMAGQSVLKHVSFRGPYQPNTAVHDPTKMYQRIFGGALPSGQESTAQIQQRLAEERSVLDILKGEIATLQSRMSPDDKIALDAHLDGLRGIEKQITNVPVASSKCEPYVYPKDVTWRSQADMTRVQMDLMTLAHICGMTKISTFMFSNANSWSNYSFVDPTITMDHHALSHKSATDPKYRPQLINIYAWQASQVAYMMDRLAAAPDPTGAGTVLDNTVILWGNELGIGLDDRGNTHSVSNVPWLLAGGTGGYFKMGRYLRLPDIAHNNLLLSVLHAMGLENETTFGKPGLVTGPIAELRG
ncbi:MAG: DUF1552 domain-containing protein [Proteobacteria bacterium]|nr:MAG: DUF1552 domain-containing protein [Pseudomonadota bacterium]